MGRCRPLIVCCSLLFAIASNAFAQDPSPEPPQRLNPPAATLSPDQEKELKRWLSAMEKWQRYDAKWHNRPVHNDWGRVVERRSPPDAPEWLAARCASLPVAETVDSDEATSVACRLLVDPRAPLKAVPPPAQAARLAAERPPKHSSFLKRIHIDGLWTTASTDGRMYGLVGSHISLVDVGRLQVFGPPGVILLSVPEANGQRRISLGYTWGVSVRLADVRLFGPTKNMTLFLNLSKVWVNRPNGQDNFRGYDIAGFSLAPRRKQ